MEKNRYDKAEVGEKKTIKGVGVITAYTFENVSNEIKDFGDKVVFEVEIQTKKIEVSKLKYEKEDKVKMSGTWISLDEDGKIPAFSAMAYFLAYMECGSINELVGKEVKIDADDSGYPVIKAY